ncbi:MAG: ABC transporter substrate-binding protein [Thermincolia bacterium]
MIKSSWKKKTFATMVGLSILALAGCGGGGGQTTAPAGQGTDNKGGGNGAPIKIGVLVPKSGAGADWGKKQEIAVNIAMDEINKAGGINGSPLEVVVEDTGSDKKQAVTLTRKFATEDKVSAILGPFFSGECEVAFPQANQLKVPIVSASSAKPGISAANRPWAFRNSMTDDKLLAEAIPKFIKKYNVKTVAIIHDAKDSWSNSVGTKLMAPLFEKNGVKVLNPNDLITYQTGDTDYTAQVTKLKQLRPDALAIGGLYQEAASIAKEMKRQNLNVPAIGGVGMYSAALIQQGEDAVEGWVATSTWWAERPDAQVQSFVEKFKPEALKITPKDGDPGLFDANTYETIHMFTNILKKTKLNGDSAPDELRNAIKDGLTNLKGFENITGKTDIDADGDGVKSIYPLIIEKGKYVVLN